MTFHNLFSLRTVCAFYALLAVTILLWYTKMGLQWWDFEGQWIVANYLWHGLNPYVSVDPQVLIRHTLPTVPEGWGTSPWGLLLGQLFYPGYLSYDVARGYFLCLALLFFLLSGVAALRAFPRHRRHVVFLMLLASVAYIRPAQGGNAGGMLCLLVCWSLVLHRHHPLLAGLCLSVAMIKPQLALLFCLYMLLTRSWRTLLTVVVVDTAAWLVVALLLQESPLRLLFDFLASGIGSDGVYRGLFTLLPLSSAHSLWTMYASMLTGVLYVLWFYYRQALLGRQTFSPLAVCVATTFWSYSWGGELLILLPLVVNSFLAASSQQGWQRALNIFIIGYASMGVIIVIALTLLFEFTPAPSPFHTAMTLYLLLLIVIFCLEKQRKMRFSFAFR